MKLFDSIKFYMSSICNMDNRNFQPVDVWSGWHFLGSFVLASVLFTYFPYTIATAGLCAFLVGVSWEVCDEIWHYIANDFYQDKMIWLDKVFDRRGLDLIDLCLDLCGCALFVYLRLLK